MFPPFFEVFWAMMQRSLLQKTKIGPPKALWTGLKIGCRTKNVDFFKVRDMLTTIQPRKKEPLTNVSSPLKTFYDHLRGCRDNLNFWIFEIFGMHL